ncbi:hypothetical protein [uncultured Bacteroides sp.]|uniref:hypothetical protein n=1 Tax=uncultured Bacteroides sp. TaxID=162156 RepID=UPI0025E2D1A2|nr:hypothetical protein [uncultured Bacteroides sp.]
MSKKGVLSSKFNMSLGFIPAIVSIVLCEFITQDISIYIGAGVGVLYSLFTLWNKGARIPNFLLYCTTGMLLLLTLTTFFFGDCSTRDMFPLTLEISTLIPIVVIFLNRRRFLAHQISQSKKCCKQLFAQGAESAIVSARVVIIITFIHLLAIFIAILVPGPLSDTARNVLFRFCPPAVFILSILFNQFGILYFNVMMEHTAFVPIVNTKGDVIGRSLAVDAINRKNEYINPVVRIAVSHNGMLYLRPRSQRCILERGKTDVPMECYLLYGETLEQSIVRLVKQAFPQAPIQDLQFNIMYHFENKVTNRLIYLFLLDIEDDNLLRDKQIKDGKLWTFQQIEHNLGKNFFSCCFENEYEHLKEVICTREKYKEF